MIYFVECGGLVKIGAALDVPKRVAHMQTGNPLPLELLGTIPGDRVVEQRLHKRFEALRFRGERFHCTGELRAFVESGFEAPYAALDGNSDFFGLIGCGFERSFYRAYARGIGGQWWRYEWRVQPIEYDPAVHFACASVETVRCCIRDLKGWGYEGDPERWALQRLLARAAEIVQ